MIDVVMPQMGESIVEGTLTKWLKKAGDRVERDEPLFEISTDKVDTEIPSPGAGDACLKSSSRKARPSGSIPWSERINDGANGAAAAPAAQPAVSPPTPSPPNRAPPPQRPSAAAPAATGGSGCHRCRRDRGAAFAAGAKMARENNIDLAQSKGTGTGGRITKLDLETISRPAQRSRRSASTATPSSAPAAAAATGSASSAVRRTRQFRPARARNAASHGDMPATRVEPMTIMRQKIAEHMVFSKHTSAHVTTVHKVDMTRIAQAARPRQGTVPGAIWLSADVSCRS